MSFPFRYPKHPHARRHGPAGYAEYESYRPWLRDEFTFRCVFCLSRETWGPFRGQFAIDHFVPVALALAPDAAVQYENLLYACITCNSVKGVQLVPDPLNVLLAGSVRIETDGSLHTDSNEASMLIEMLDLNEPRWVEFRSLWISVFALAERFDPALYHRLSAFPIDLPDLSTLKPPNNNARPRGIVEAFFALRERGELPESY